MTFPVHRPRRLRIDSRLRKMVREIFIRPEQLVFPLFVSEGLTEKNEIGAMPGQFQWPVDMIEQPVIEAMKHGVSSFLLFGVPKNKDAAGNSAIASESVICRAIRRIRSACPEAYIITDVCLCAYTDHGHCGMLCENGGVDNDSTLLQLAKMALSHVAAGADMVAPSDMMDGRIGAIRKILDDNGFVATPIMAYSAKYASAFYGPFREAADSAPGKGDRKGYQMDFAVARDAKIEFAGDLEEGADILMVKPGMAYLDIVSEAHRCFSCPIAIYQVSGEYSMILAAAEKGWINEKQVVLESLTAMRRAGADIIISYFSVKVAQWLKEEAC